MVAADGLLLVVAGFSCGWGWWWWAVLVCGGGFGLLFFFFFLRCGFHVIVGGGGVVWIPCDLDCIDSSLHFLLRVLC